MNDLTAQSHQNPSPQIERTGEGEVQHVDKYAALDGGATHQTSEWQISSRWASVYELPVSGIAKAVYGYLAYRANADTGKCWPGMGAISKAIGFSRDSVIRGIKELESGGHLTIQRLKVCRDGHLVNASNRYQLVRGGGSSSQLLGGSSSQQPKQVRTEQVSTKVQAAAVPRGESSKPEPAPKQQQLTLKSRKKSQEERRCERDERRTDGMLKSCAISWRVLRRPKPFERQWHLDELAAGRLTLGQLQEFTDLLLAKRNEIEARVRL